MSDRTYCVDGELVPASSATVSVTDRGFKYGDAAFETLRAYGGEPFAWDEHLDRLSHTCQLLGFEPGYDRSELLTLTNRTLAANDLTEAYIRLSISRGSHGGKLDPPDDPEPMLVIIVSELPRGGTDGTDVWTSPATAAIVETRRVSNDALPSDAKTHNYLNGILARSDSTADETIMLDADGHLTEGATSNLFFCTDETLRTPSLSGSVLPGITRELVIDLARDCGFDVETGSYTPAALYESDGAFFTNTTWEVRPIERVGDRTYGDCSIIDRLRTAFDEYVEAEHYP